MPNTLGNFLKKAEDFLRKKHLGNPRFEAQVIFSHFLQMKRFELFTNSEKPLEVSEIDLLREKISLRAKGMPVAYITGKREFMGLSFKCDMRALVPRPETEELVELVLGWVGDEPSNVCDMCCGSGVMGISLAKRKKNVKVTLADISEEALDLTRENLEIISVESERVRLIQSDLFERFSPHSGEKYQVIMSNPPYILDSERETLPRDVLEYEPHIALFVKQPEKFFARLFAGAARHLAPGGKFIAETSPGLVNPQLGLLQESGFINTKAIIDLSGKNRFIYGQVPTE